MESVIWYAKGNEGMPLNNAKIVKLVRFDTLLTDCYTFDAQGLSPTGNSGSVSVFNHNE